LGFVLGRFADSWAVEGAGHTEQLDVDS